MRKLFLALLSLVFVGSTAFAADPYEAYAPGEIVSASYYGDNCVAYDMYDDGQVHERSATGFVLIAFSNEADARCLIAHGGVRTCVVGECATWLNTRTRGSGNKLVREIRKAGQGRAFMMKVPAGMPILLPARLAGPVGGCDTSRTGEQELWELRASGGGYHYETATVYAASPAPTYYAPPPVVYTAPAPQPCVRCSPGNFLWSRY